MKLTRCTTDISLALTELPTTLKLTSSESEMKWIPFFSTQRLQHRPICLHVWRQIRVRDVIITCVLMLEYFCSEDCLRFTWLILFIGFTGLSYLLALKYLYAERPINYRVMSINVIYLHFYIWNNFLLGKGNSNYTPC